MSFAVELPNGMRVACLQKHEVRLVNKEIESYFSNGVQISPGDTVFDVGANIGLFSLAACARVDRNLRVFAFEPVRAIFDLLQQNIAHNSFSSQVEALAIGLSSKAAPLKLAFYPEAPVLSTAYPDEASDVAVMKDAVLKSIMYLEEAPLALKCLRFLPSPLRQRVVEFGLKKTLRGQTVDCDMHTISGFLRERQIERIDYLKIDVERAELDVLRGVEADNWQKIRQVVVEVHDIEDRLHTITSLLSQHGLDKIVVSQVPTLTDSNIFVVFAVR